MRVCLYEDHGVDNLEPLILSRPVFELLCGQDSLGAKQARAFAASELGWLVRPSLVPLCQAERPNAPVNDFTWLRSEATVLVNGRWLPPSNFVPDLSRPCIAIIGEEVAYAILTPEQLTYCSPNTFGECLETWKQTLASQPAEGRLLRYLWDFVEQNAEQLRLEFRGAQSGPRLLAPGLALVGPVERLSVAPTAQIDPLVVADTTRGPITVDDDAVVTAFSRLEGPCYIGRRTHVLGAKIRAGTTIGPDCRIGGEVESSIILGKTNKYHDGFLGHSYVGEWVNFGAGTQNSDLRNDYGEVNVTVQGRDVGTGLSKVGCFIGDHTKTGLGALLNTGTHAGVFCNLLPTGSYLPRYVPSFCSVWNGTLVDNANLARLFCTAGQVTSRRGTAFTDSHADFFRRLFNETAAQRQRALARHERRKLKRPA
jgi:UDP-N-acetylglucosamine diphosphorylase / glucose-1-phosphate thymidylyltransferase / UDP-N-acetylgalactosamine diphosphorylase / glucosamine-1-phosphate N-acetyltransferase / galactosamine-1-phosphate N-acetyltransferase